MTPRRHDRGGPDRWLVSYADLVTLLLAFFTTLYAASTVDAGRLALTPSDLPGGGGGITAMEALSARLSEALEGAVAETHVEITRDARGLVVSLPEEAAFPVASSEMAEPALELIARVARAVEALPNPIRIEGHTDDVPIRTPRYTSNWELSTARASAVVAYLVETVGVEPSRLSAAGYGEFHPRVPNDSAANRAKNRRIDIVVLEHPPADQPAPLSPYVEAGSVVAAGSSPPGDPSDVAASR